MQLSVIYPVHITKNSKYIIKRINKCLSNTLYGLPQAEHIIVLSGDKKYIQAAKVELENLKASANITLSIKVYLWRKTTYPYSPGTARNIGIRAATKQQVLFWDIDLLGSPALFTAIPRHLKIFLEQPEAFYMYPCLYLTDSYSKHFTNDFKQAYQDVLQLKPNTIEHIALATSTLLCDKQHLINLGAFDESFVGHMGEDLELINRLAITYNKYPLQEDHLIDSPSKIPNQLKGFRRLFAKYALPNFNKQKFTVHISHKTQLSSNYKKNQAKNMEYLQKKIHDSVINFTLKSGDNRPLSNIVCLSTLPLIKLTTITKFIKKWNKLFREPRLFFRDMKIKKNNHL
jgi:predicted glycosyltransferase involved in capsule biosynthesis